MKTMLPIAAVMSALVASAAVSGQSVRLSPAETERNVHVAREGDTLFDLSARYLGDPMRWPQLWSYNPQITNPHWIYPGDVVFLEAVRPPEPPLRPAMETAGVFPLGGFYSSTEIEHFGTLKYADTGRRLLAPLDTVYLELDDPDSVEVGDRFAINRVIGRVYERRRELVAVKYLVTGMVEVTEKHEETHLVSARITQLWDTIERGDVLFASQEQLLDVTEQEATVDLEAEIIDHLTPDTQLHEQHVVFINRGSSDGVVAGNTFIIWDRQDEAEMIRAARTRRLDYEDDIRSELPWEIAGEAYVIYTTEDYSTALITDAGMRELRDGMRVTMQSGH